MNTTESAKNIIRFTNGPVVFTITFNDHVTIHNAHEKHALLFMIGGAAGTLDLEQAGKLRDWLNVTLEEK